MLRLRYESALDGVQDWALFRPGDTRRNTIVYLHGSFAEADQIVTRKDVRDFWLRRCFMAVSRVFRNFRVSICCSCQAAICWWIAAVSFLSSP